VPEPGGEAVRVASLRAGDLTALEKLVIQHTPVMSRVARDHMASQERPVRVGFLGDGVGD
jgi:hypothetical protein